MSDSELRTFALTILGVVVGGIALALVRANSATVRSLLGEPIF